MKTNILGFAAILAIAFCRYSTAQQIAWDDTNEVSALVIGYRVYAVEGGTPVKLLSTVSSPESRTNPYTHVMDVDKPTFEGKEITVTAFTSGGLESEPASPNLKLATEAKPPGKVSMAFDFVSRTMDIRWVDTNSTSAAVGFFRVFRKLDDSSWEKIAQTTNATISKATFPIPSGAGTYAVAAVNFWGESKLSEPVSVPTIMVPVSNLRTISVATP